MLANETSEPLAQSTSLVRHLVQFTRHRSHPQLIQRIRWNKLGLSQPLQEAIAVVEPVNRCIDRCRDGVEEIEAERVGDENCRRSVLHDWPPSKQAKEVSRITYQTAIDKLCCARHNLSSSIELVMKRRSLSGAAGSFSDDVAALDAACCLSRNNRFSRIDEVTSRGGFDGDQIPHGRCGWFQGFLSRGRADRCADAAARLPERGPHVP